MTAGVWWRGMWDAHTGLSASTIWENTSKNITFDIGLRVTGPDWLGVLLDFLFPSKIGEEQSAEDAEDGPPELLVSDILKPKLLADF